MSDKQQDKNNKRKGLRRKRGGGEVYLSKEGHLSKKGLEGKPEVNSMKEAGRQ